MTTRPWIQSLAVGIFFSLLLNASNLLLWLQGELTEMHLLNLGMDEAYYLSVIRGMARGVGSLAGASLAAMPQAFFMRITGADFVTVIFLGDLIYPALAAAFLFLAALWLLKSWKLAAITALLAATSLENYWLRSANPQLPYLLVAAYAAAFCYPRSRPWVWIARGLLIGLLVYAQLLYASLLILVEAVDACRRFLIARERFRQLCLQSLMIVMGFAVIALPHILSMLFSDADVAAVDTYHRLGVLPNHYPAAPVLQVKLILIAGLLLFARYRTNTDRRGIDIALTFIVAMLIGLNQAIVHGIDATYSSYYVNVLLLLRWAVLPILAIGILGRTRLATTIVLFALILSLWNFLGFMWAETEVNAARAVESTQNTEVFDWLKKQKDSLVIAAPFVLSNIIPVRTDHNVLFASYAYNWRVTDEELAKRYLLHHALFDERDPLDVERGYPSVFGGYAGMLAARQRTACKYWAAVLFKKQSCGVSPRTLVLHQDLLAMLDRARADIPALMKEFRVGAIITDRPLPGGVRGCKMEQKLGKYSIYQC